jgi:NAD-dependent dihydropyrimidine dehydrogenase PreA subunit
MFSPIVYDKDICQGCNNCVEVCLMDILKKAPIKGKTTPSVAYPDECAYDGACWMQCPNRERGAIRVVPPLPMRVAILRGADERSGS